MMPHDSGQYEQAKQRIDSFFFKSTSKSLLINELLLIYLLSNN